MEKKTFEELKGMTQEDLVRTVLELQHESSFWHEKWLNADIQLGIVKEKLSDIIKTVL